MLSAASPVMAIPLSAAHATANAAPRWPFISRRAGAAGTMRRALLEREEEAAALPSWLASPLPDATCAVNSAIFACRRSVLHHLQPKCHESSRKRVLFELWRGHLRPRAVEHARSASSGRSTMRQADVHCVCATARATECALTVTQRWSARIDRLQLDSGVT